MTNTFESKPYQWMNAPGRLPDTADEEGNTMSVQLKPVLIEFNAEDVQRLLSIALDGGGEEALVFIRHDLVKRVEKALQRH
jgi:hypothetical protein